MVFPDENTLFWFCTSFHITVHIFFKFIFTQLCHSVHCHCNYLIIELWLLLRWQGHHMDKGVLLKNGWSKTRKVFPESQVCLFRVCVFIPDLLHFDMILSCGERKTTRDFISGSKHVPYILMLLYIFLECCI